MDQLKDLKDFADLLSHVKLVIETNPENFPHYNKHTSRRLKDVQCRGSRTQDWWSGEWEFECGYGAEFECSQCCCDNGNLDPRLFTELNNRKYYARRNIAIRRFSIRKNRF